MNEQEMIDIWQSFDQKLQSVLEVNRKNAIEITRLKVSSNLGSAKPIKWFAILVGLGWCLILGAVFSISLLHQPPHFIFISFMMLLLAINVIGVGMYIYHLFLIGRIDHAENVAAAQRDLAKLQTSTLTVTRILILQIPFYASLHLFLTTEVNVIYWVVNLLIIGGFIAGTLWLFFKIDPANRHERWFQLLFNDPEWNSVVKSIEMLDQIDELEYSQPAN